ncbi:hypothetical protein MKW94_010124 [Papaver nudicaule]|uniref:Uncharacterized protein n=1 Tax=Papaver nudicaule TaxID=74823 RepID=A0AA42B5B9_PAPNU|nr:hypothetical protein [Papaver nudicaule]MCL7051354.1 hypothetical protein [Papaver nudicaule]
MAIHGANGEVWKAYSHGFLGNGCLFSWNSLLNSLDYFGDIFPKYHPARVLTLVYQPFALGAFAILTYNEAKINTRRRNLLSRKFPFHSVLHITCPQARWTYIGVCLVSSAYGVAAAHAQGGMVGDLSLMCPEFIHTSSFLAGFSFSGALSSALRLITKVAFEKSKDGLRKGALMFFAISALFELLSLLLYAYILPKLPIVKYYSTKAASEGSKTVSADLAAGGVQTLSSNQVCCRRGSDRLSNKELFVQNLDFAIAMFLIYVLSFSIFPGFLSEDTGKHSLVLEVGVTEGSPLCVSLSRFLLVPCFYFTAKYGDQGWMIMLTSVLGLTGGFTVCILTVAPKGYKVTKCPWELSYIVSRRSKMPLGIFTGAALDWLWLIGKSW